mgnify:CR=1 FL=1
MVMGVLTPKMRLIQTEMVLIMMMIFVLILHKGRRLMLMDVLILKRTLTVTGLLMIRTSVQIPLRENRYSLTDAHSLSRTRMVTAMARTRTLSHWM